CAENGPGTRNYGRAADRVRKKRPNGLLAERTRQYSRAGRKNSCEAPGSGASDYLSPRGHRYPVGYCGDGARHAEGRRTGKHQRGDPTARQSQTMNPEEKFGRWIGMSIVLHVALFSLAIVWPS